MIISTNPDKLAKAIDEQIGRGLTILNGHIVIIRVKKKMSYTLLFLKHKFQKQSD